MSKKSNLPAQESIEVKDKPESFSGIAVAAFKVGELLADSVELKIENGVVIEVKRLCRGADLPAVSIGNCNRVLWKSYKLQKGKAQ